eukprot:g37823.t1
MRLIPRRNACLGTGSDRKSTTALTLQAFRTEMVFDVLLTGNITFRIPYYGCKDDAICKQIVNTCTMTEKFVGDPLFDMGDTWECPWIEYSDTVPEGVSK